MPSKKKRKPLRSGLIILLVVVAGIGGYALYYSFSNSDSEPAAEESPATQVPQTETTTEETTANQNQNTATVAEVTDVTLDTDILQDEQIRNFIQFGDNPVTVAPSDLGRTDPFAPL